MMNDYNILRYEDAMWNVSGLFSHDRVLLFFYDLMLQCGVNLPMTVHGNIPCKWNSGRIIQSVNESYQKKCLDEYAKRNIPIFLTCSNYFINKDDLQDTLSNRILELVASYPNAGVISGSELLSDYIRKAYPDIILSTSILRTVHDHGQGKAEYYSSLTQCYDRVVLHPDDGFSIEVIKKIKNKNKIEILVNENCIRNCPVREEHCDIVCRYYKNRRNAVDLEEIKRFKKTKCSSVQNISTLQKFLNGTCTTCNMTKEELDSLYRIGCRYFKIQGRSLSPASLLFDATRYMLNDSVVPTIYKMIMDRIESFNKLEDNNILKSDYSDWERL